MSRLKHALMSKLQSSRLISISANGVDAPRRGRPAAVVDVGARRLPFLPAPSRAKRWRLRGPVIAASRCGSWSALVAAMTSRGRACAVRCMIFEPWAGPRGSHRKRRWSPQRSSIARTVRISFGRIVPALAALCAGLAHSMLALKPCLFILDAMPQTWTQARTPSKRPAPHASPSRHARGQSARLVQPLRWPRRPSRARVRLPSRHRSACR